MKKLIFIPILLIALTANAQNGSIGIDNMYISLSDMDGFKSVHAEAAHIQPIVGPIVTRAGVGIGFSEFQNQGSTDKNLKLNINPSVMTGVRIPIHPTIKLGIYSGYHTNINAVGVTHHFLPVSVSVSFVNIR